MYRLPFPLRGMPGVLAMMKHCPYCGGRPEGIRQEGRVFVVFGCCDEFEIPDARTKQEAEFLWDHGDKEGWTQLLYQVSMF